MIRCLIARDDATALSQGQVYPFHRYRGELAQRFRFEFEDHPHADASRLRERLQAVRWDLVMVQSRRALIEETQRILDLVRAAAPRAKVVFLDAADSTYARHFRLLPRVDLYIKGQLLADRSFYGNTYLDGRIFADYMIRLHQLPHAFEGAVFGDDPQLDKVMLGWNFGASERFERPFAERDYAPWRNDHRALDVCCRVRTQWPRVSAWYVHQRTMAIDTVQSMGGRHRVVATDTRIPRDHYLEELRDSLLTVSPFGWGEVCGRDFDAVTCGSLLVKPSMDHVATQPNIYLAGKTYVAVKWDLSDLVEKCEYYLQHSGERDAIVGEAGRCFARYFREQEFLLTVEEMLNRLHA